jgi:hypothetical protein
VTRVGVLASPERFKLPSHSEVRSLVSCSLDHGEKRRAGEEGIEPSRGLGQIQVPYRLGDSPTLFWRDERASNPQPAVLETAALPVELSTR